MYVKHSGNSRGIPPLAKQAYVCPFCGVMGGFTEQTAVYAENNRYSLQVCPSRECHGVVAFISDLKGEVIKTYPALGAPVNGENVPEKIVKVLKEAVDCFSAGHYTASAIMIRRTLEEICAHEGAEGHNLQARIEALKSRVVLPTELLEVMHELRLLGNDAAHVKANSFAEIGQKELEVSIVFTKEIIKALYQYESLLASLRSFKKASE